MANRELYFPRLTRRHTYSRYAYYKHYRHEIREDCQGRCVYCDIHENELGGIEFMTLDHFRPQRHFSDLTHQPRNLVWSCLPCNQNKGQTWPAIGTSMNYVKSGGFVDPFAVDMHSYFDVSDEGRLVALNHPAHYMIRVMKLNRDGASRNRKKRRIEYESRERSLKALALAIRETDDALDHPDLPDELRPALTEHKERLCREYDAVLVDTKPDFTLK